MKGYFIVDRDELESYGASKPMTREEVVEALRAYDGLGMDIVVIYGEIVPRVLGAEPVETGQIVDVRA